MVPWLNRPNGCGHALNDGAIYYEHIIPDNIRPDNSLENCAVLCKTCWREKTAKYDLPVIAKSNRTRDRAQGIKKPKRGFGRKKEAKPLSPKVAGLRRMRESQS